MSLADLISGHPIADDSDDGDARMGSVSGRGASDDEESNKGVDLMGENTGDEDSSDEGEDDSEEEREVRKGFIVDEEESSSRKKKKKRRTQRGSDDGESSKKRRKDSDDDAGDLDEDDLALVEENTGVKLTGRSKGHKLKRLRRRRSASDASDASGPTGDLNNIFDDDERGGDEDRYGGQELFDADEMAGFIEDDTQSESSGRHGSGSEDEDDRAARKAMKKKQRQKEKTKGRGRRAGFGAGFVEGITAEAWQEVTDVFGNGTDYAYALEDDAENQGEKELKDIFEPSEIASRMLTVEDDRIRTLDIPERMQLTSVGLAAPINSSDDIDDATAPFIPEDELTDAANWMASQISATATEHFALQDANGNLPELHEQFLKAVADVIRFINIEFLEVPFIWAHRGDFLVHRAAAESGQQDTAFLDQDDCWKIAHLSIKYRALAQRKAELRKTFNSLEADDEYFEDVFDRVKSVEDVADLSEWVGMKYSRKLAEIKEEKMRDEEAQGEDGDQPKRKKRATRESAYENAKRNVVSKLAEAIGLSATELSKAYFSTIKGESIDDPATEPLVLAEGYCGGGSEYPTPDAALNAAKMIAIHEISRDPQLKGEARRFFRDYAVVSVTPTEKGQSKIDEMHSFYAFKYLRNKPLSLFLRSPQFLQILTAEKEDLVEARIELPEAAIDKFYEDLHQYYTTDLSSSVAEAWNEVRREILHTAVHSHLVPSAQSWARNYLQEEEEEFVGNICRMKLGQRINVAPYRRQDGSMEKGEIPTVVALSHGRGDPQRDDVTYCFIDSDGHFRENGTISNLFSPNENEREQFVDLLKRRRPQVVVIGGFSPATKRLMADFRSFAQGVTDSIVAEEEADPSDAEEKITPDERHRRAVFEAIYVYDDVAKIYMNSQRAQLEFPDLTKIGKYCIGLARYAQSPISEYAALGPDLTALTYDPNQKFLPVQKLVPHLEKALIEVVNRLGVDINKAIRNAYYYHLLPYVAGLGPRKADGIVKKINSNVGGTLTTRHGLITHNITTKNVFMNAAGFLRIPQDDLRTDIRRTSDEEEQPEVLDDTRIHPEEYEITRKMAADAMEIDEEETSRYKTPSQAVIDLMEEDATKLDDLSLDDFAVELQKLLQVPKRLALYAIRDELQNPYAEPRPDFHSPTAVEVFTMLSGETQATLDRGLIIPVRYLKMTPDGVVRVRLDSGLEGSVQVGYRADEDGEGRYRPPPQGSTLQALVVELRHETFEVELSTQESAISHGDRDRRRTIPDYAYWDQNLAEAEKEAQAAVEQKATGRQKRVLKHPSFQNVDSGKAEEYLSHMQRGDCVIRPSSKEDHLAVTWKVGEGIYQHVAVHELNKANPWSLGSTLRIAGAGAKEYTYSDLDELIVSHIKQMALKVNEMTAHEKFKGSKTELDTWLSNASMANPDRSFYGFAFDPDRRKAGQFVLGFRANLNSQSEHWPIKVVPGAFVLMNQEHGSVLALCNAFKHAYGARTSSNSARLPGKTPMHLGGRTPMPGGRTPMPGVPGSAMGAGAVRTPNPYRQGGATPNPHRGGATPNPRGGATPNPYRPQEGATPMYPGGGADPRGQPYGQARAYGQGGPGAPNQGHGQQQQEWQPHQNQPWGQQQNQGAQGGNYGQQQWGNGH